MIKHNFDEALGAFNQDLQKAVVETNANGAEIALEAYRLISTRSPVDTGRFRASNFLTVDSSTTETVKEGANFKSEEQANMRDAEARLSKLDLQKNKYIRIQNNLEYAEALENGHSKQAPRGVYAITGEIIKRLL